MMIFSFKFYQKKEFVICFGTKEDLQNRVTNGDQILEYFSVWQKVILFFSLDDIQSERGNVRHEGKRVSHWGKWRVSERCHQVWARGGSTISYSWQTTWTVQMISSEIYGDWLHLWSDLRFKVDVSFIWTWRSKSNLISISWSQICSDELTTKTLTFSQKY